LRGQGECVRGRRGCCAVALRLPMGVGHGHCGL
jgi:hypothetical protein